MRRRRQRERRDPDGDERERRAGEADDRSRAADAAVRIDSVGRLA
jgi:hypothetical protein